MSEALKLRRAALGAVEKGHWKKAVDCYTALGELERKDALWPQKAGEMYRKLGRTPDAVAAYVRAVEIYAKSGMLVKAIALCKTVLELEPGHTAAQEKLALMHGAKAAPAAPPAASAQAQRRAGRSSRSSGSLPLARLALVERRARPPSTATNGRPLEIVFLEEPAVAAARRALPKTPLFSALSPPHLQRLIEGVQLVELAPWQVLFMRGDPGDALYVIASGEISVRGDEEMARLGEGAFFGEIALLVDQPRTASAVATQPTQLLAIDRTTVNALVAESSQLLAVFLRFVRDRLCATLMDTSPLFGPLDAASREDLARRFRFLEAPRGARILVEGTPASGLYVLLAGKAAVQRGRTSVAHLGAGDVFGEISLLGGRPATASVQTTARSFLLELPRADFKEIILTHPHVLEYVSNVADDRERAIGRLPLA